MNLRQTVGLRVREARLKQNLTQANLGKRSGLSGDWICAIERGHRGSDMLTMKKLGAALGVTVDWLMSVDKKTNHNPKRKVKSNGKN
jgi:transcriptional regulator with XRE-family HTH domain